MLSVCSIFILFVISILFMYLELGLFDVGMKVKDNLDCWVYDLFVDGFGEGFNG